MTLDERVDYLEGVFFNLQMTNSLVEKRDIINRMPSELKEDFNYILECLNGIHKFGYKYRKTYGDFNNHEWIDNTWTVKGMLQYLQCPIKDKDLSENNILNYIVETNEYEDFLEPIVNRTLKLGIGKSLFDKSNISPMLAKKYEGKIDYDYYGYYITEKLDGNRCIAYYEDDKWHFVSRNGKDMHVNFDMSKFPIEYIYDGEVLSPEQVKLSKAINAHQDVANVGSFNETSGLINSHTLNKKLVYNIFDVIDPLCKELHYEYRRSILDSLYEYTNETVRILPVLKYYNTYDKLEENIYDLLDEVTSKGGEGLMINLGGAPYEHKRTDKLLKLKKVQTMDMKVISTMSGTGKYEGLIGSLICEAKTEDGKFITCNVGSGLSDLQRELWSIHNNLIVGKIVEVAYFDISQDKNSKNTNSYSLRFPRLKKVREDKNETSEY